MFSTIKLLTFAFLLFPIYNVRGDSFVGISNEEFQAHYRPQSQPMWCWASSAEMVLSYQGIKMEQEAIVSMIKGFPINQGGNFMEMIRSVNGVFKDANGAQVIVSGQFVSGPPLTTVLFNHLKAKRPLVLTYQANQFSGHAVVVTGADFSISGSSVQISKLHIFDPFCYSMKPQPIFYPNGMLAGFQQGFNKDDSLIASACPLQFGQFGLVLVGRGVLTGVILIEGSR